MESESSAPTKRMQSRREARSSQIVRKESERLLADSATVSPPKRRPTQKEARSSRLVREESARLVTKSATPPRIRPNQDEACSS